MLLCRLRGLVLAHAAVDSVLALFQGITVLAVVAILMATAARRHLDSIQEEIAKFHGLPGPIAVQPSMILPSMTSAPPAHGSTADHASL